MYAFSFSNKSLRFVQFSWLPNWARFDAEDSEWSASTTSPTPAALHEICVVSHATRSDGPWRCTLGCSCDNPALYPLPLAVRDLRQPVMAPAPNGTASVVRASSHNGTLDHQLVARARDGVHWWTHVRRNGVACAGPVVEQAVQARPMRFSGARTPSLV